MTIDKHGGNFIDPTNFLNERNLDYLIEIIDANMFGDALYPSLWDKAGLYMYNIIANHVFQDGNKRTGLEVASVFIRLNGNEFSESLNDQELIDFTINVASGNLSLEETQAWFKENIVLNKL